MSTDILEYENESIVEIKIDVSPGDTLPASALVVRDASNRVRHRIALTPGNIGTWIDLTEHVRTAGQGSVEAELLGTAGDARWNGKISVRTRPSSDPFGTTPAVFSKQDAVSSGQDTRSARMHSQACDFTNAVAGISIAPPSTRPAPMRKNAAGTATENHHE